jgi:hypothetical protein
MMLLVDELDGEQTDQGVTDHRTDHNHDFLCGQKRLSSNKTTEMFRNIIE